MAQTRVNVDGTAVDLSKPDGWYLFFTRDELDADIWEAVGPLTEPILDRLAQELHSRQAATLASDDARDALYRFENHPIHDWGGQNSRVVNVQSPEMEETTGYPNGCPILTEDTHGS